MASMAGPAATIAEANVRKAAIGGQRTNEMITTKEGTYYLSKPYRSSYNKKLKAAIAFVPRRSLFDIENEQSSTNEFRGFFTLFWISMFLFTVRSYVRSIETNGYPLNFEFASMFSRHSRTLALSDAVLVLSTGLCIPFAKVVRRGWIPYYWVGIVFQHCSQILILVTAIKWTFNRQWPWVQSGFLTLHTLVLIMKMHSYMSTNGYMSWASAQSDQILAQLRAATERVGGWDMALAAANLHRVSIDDATRTSSPGICTPDLPEGSQKSYVDAAAAAALRNRLVRANEIAAARASSESSASETEKPKPVGPAPHPLVDHPDEEISALATSYTEVQADLVSSGPEYVHWPDNITLKNFVVYMLIPTLVYELEYPRTNKIRPLYVFEKTVATFGTFALLYSVTESFILPLTPGPDQSFFRSLLDLAFPFMLAYLLLFYIIFECICNGFAELSYFADRGFYEDWWNSTSWDEFSRKWNKPVHTFLLRHVYASTISSYHLSRTSAMFVTFFISACAHELVMAVVTQKIRMYLFTLQLIQIPLIAVGRTPAIKRNKLMGNIVFWLGLYAGFPLLCVAYVAH